MIAKRMQRTKKIFTRTIDNESVVSEEQLGYGPEIVVGHTTHIADPEVRRAITKLSIMTIIS